MQAKLDHAVFFFGVTGIGLTMLSCYSLYATVCMLIQVADRPCSNSRRRLLYLQLISSRAQSSKIEFVHTCP